VSPVPLALYIHFPWCIRKCPYCDFNSHEIKNAIPEEDYLKSLMQDFSQEWEALEIQAPLESIFMGGGTPSLFSPKTIDHLLNFIFKKTNTNKNIEVTMEANPSTVELKRFSDFYQAGVNRLSLGIQSFQDEKLKRLGRVHDALQAKQAIDAICSAQFSRFNLDMMHGLPFQTVEEALQDIETALSFSPPHFSWYQLTVEPNTYFHRFPPKLPEEDILFEIQTQGHFLLESKGLMQYEISAYSLPGFQCRHNVNYWEFGDYMGIGAGAHGKISTKKGILRYWKYRQPTTYLNQTSYRAEEKIIKKEELPFEFMLNTLRLKKIFSLDLFTARTGLDKAVLEKPLLKAQRQGLLKETNGEIQVTPLGYQFLNDLIALFM